MHATLDYLRHAAIAAISFISAIIETIIHTTIAPIYAYISAVWAGTENPLWLHLVLIPGSVLAGVAVGLGIVFERPKCSEAVQHIGFWLVVLGVAVESLCTVSLFVVDERISIAQQSTIIDLMRAAGSRRIDAGPFLSALSGKPIAQVLIEASPEAPDGLSTAAQISSLLIKAGWPKPEYKDMEEKYRNLVRQAQAPEPEDLNDLRTSSRIYLISGLPNSGFGSAFNALLLAIAGGLHTTQNGLGDPSLAPTNMLVVLIFPR